MSNSLVSVVIPTFNGSRFIIDTLFSVMNQSILPVELIVVDDRSSDDTVERVREFANVSPFPVSILNMEVNTGGPAVPLNRGVKAANGDICAILEQDDLMHPRRIELAIAAMDAFPNAGLVVGKRSVIQEKDTLNSIDWDGLEGKSSLTFPSFDGVFFELGCCEALNRILQANFVSSNSNMTFRKSVWQAIGGFGKRWRTNSDIDFALRAVIHAPVVLVNTLALAYRIHDDSLWHSNVDKGVIDGYMIRLRVCNSRPDWAKEYYDAACWSLVRALLQLVKRGRVADSFEVVLELKRNQAFFRYFMPRLRSKLTLSG